MMLVDRFIKWAQRRSPPQSVITFDGVHLFTRFAPFWPDEYCGRNRPPWYRPFNVLLHNWQHGESGAFHDHPRWSVTIVLKGRITEVTPWRRKLLNPGSIVFRSRKAIHAFELPQDHGDVWTLFIVGRRNHEQNSYVVEPRGGAASGLQDGVK